MPVLSALLVADRGSFVSALVERADLVFGGFAGDLHAGATRGADSRTRWHPRGAPIANTREISLVSREECAEIAARLGVDEVDPALLGANLVTQGLPDLTGLPPATRLQFPSGATLFITEDNAPCRQPGAKIAERFGRPELELDFVKAAMGRRGLVAIVEREGALNVGNPIKVIAKAPRRFA